jgi:hypothetical protein
MTMTIRTDASHAQQRREAAEFIELLIGRAIPHGTDAAFRAALREDGGSLLCFVLQKLDRGSEGKVQPKVGV